MDALREIATFALAVAFGWAGVSKIARPREFARALALQRIPARIAAGARLLVPAFELSAAALLVVGSVREGALLALALLAAFSLARVRASAIAGQRVPCGCFGGSGERDYRVLLARNALLAALAVIAAGAPLDGIDAPGAGELAPTLLSAAGIALAAWTACEAILHLRPGAGRSPSRSIR